MQDQNGDHSVTLTAMSSSDTCATREVIHKGYTYALVRSTHL